MKGYSHPNYVESFKEFGTPRKLPRCGGWVIERLIPGFPYRDAMGCYPLFVCQDWSQLHSDLKLLEGELVSLSLVTDPFGQYDSNLLHQCFEVVFPFKKHFVTDLTRPLDRIVTRHHRYYAQRSLRKISVERCHDPLQFIDEWTDLYACLIRRHNLKGFTAFSRTTLARQMNIPGFVMFRALYEGKTVGAHIWYSEDEVCYSHLSAFNSVGYGIRASYALYWIAIEYFASKKFQKLDLGSGAGVRSKENDGLVHFKSGWATGTQTVYFCGRIIDNEKYAEILNAKSDSLTDYFPSYRKFEFV